MAVGADAEGFGVGMRLLVVFLVIFSGAPGLATATGTASPGSMGVPAVAGGVIGVDLGLAPKGGGVPAGVARSSGWVTAREPGVVGRSTRRSDVVGLLS